MTQINRILLKRFYGVSPWNLFDGEAVKVSEYTMSEIIASVYRVMEESGKREGILFLEPEGWGIVTAGNPPQYNKSVKDFDVAALDRLKCFSIEEDFGIWKSYAYQNGIHAAIITFLRKKQKNMPA